ncbi:glycosyltransferase family 4 protein [Nocardioides sp. W7]|uniref:glycosyltransferase family 4 protein n=1 Tax=Nocardioides sp. W7 TaxID=2931390 RepID=UPI001FD4AEBD|nr:glycosyltransferase family 4 protein [Nocardioides sp. W7]
MVNWRDLDHSAAGGSEHYAWEFSRALHEAGASVDFITARDRGQSRSDLVDGIRIVRGGNQFTFYLFAALALLRRRKRLDLVVDPECGIPSWSPLYVGRRTALVLVVHHVHQEQFATYFPAPLAWLGQVLERVVMPRVYRGVRTIAVSPSTHAEMIERLGWTGPVEVVANGTAVPPADRFDPAGQEPDRVAVLGRLVPHKRVDLVLRAIRDLTGDRPALRLDVLGRGPDEERLRALAAELGIAERVCFHGFVTEERKWELLRLASLHVAASDSEGWGQVVIEAAGCGVPTVARDVPGLRDSVRPGETGWLVADDADLDVVGARLSAAMAQALAELSDPGERDVSFAACQAWAGRFTWARMRSRVTEIAAAEVSASRRGRRD